MTSDRDHARSFRAARLPRSQDAGKRAVTCIAVASGKGGVGKTFVAVNLAVAMQLLNRRVLLVDADFGLANADIVLGVNPSHSLQDVLFQGFDLAEVVAHTAFGVDLLAASSGTREMVSLGRVRMALFVEQLMGFAAGYDVLIFDCATGINENVTAFIAAAPRCLLVATPQPTSIMDVYALTKVIHHHRLVRDVGLVLNMVEDEEQGRRVSDRLLEVTSAHLSLPVKFWGTIPQSTVAVRAEHRRVPLVASSPEDVAARRVTDIAMAVLREQTPSVDLHNLNASGLLDGMRKG